MQACVLIEYNTLIEMSRVALLLALMIAAHAQEYTLQLDWAVSTSSSSQVGYITWNDQTLITLTNTPNNHGSRHESVAMSFIQGSNQLGIYFLGLSGTLSIDNVSITKASSSINYILNGDFEMCQLNAAEQLRVFPVKIPGWTAPQITVGKSANGGVQLVLSTQSRSVTQSISFGMVNKYQFIDSINAAIQSQAKDIISANMPSININPSQGIWNTSFLQQNRTFTPPNLLGSFQNNQTQPPLNAQNINAQVTQLIQLVTNVTASLLSH